MAEPKGAAKRLPSQAQHERTGSEVGVDGSLNTEPEE